MLFTAPALADWQSRYQTGERLLREGKTEEALAELKPALAEAGMAGRGPSRCGEIVPGSGRLYSATWAASTSHSSKMPAPRRCSGRRSKSSVANPLHWRACALENPIRTESGLIAGTVGDISVFKGIPYAAPPVAGLRWRPPQPALPWIGVREAKEFGPQCVYRGPGAFAGPGSEDCLTLNVWTPAKRRPRERLPVMVWIHGGGFQFGSGRWPLYEGTGLARLGVVLVTLNYRLNIFGFFSHPDLSKESPNGASGNYGLLDQIAALKWVTSNIDAFGGDRKRITIFGESAGGSSVAYLMISPLAKGLFHRAIISSTNIPSSAPHSREARYGIQPAEDLGIGHGSQVAALRTKSVKEILALARPDCRYRYFLHYSMGLLAGGGWLGDTGRSRGNVRSGTIPSSPVAGGTCGNEGGFFAVLSRKAEAADYEKWATQPF